jgi:molybdate transport system substrate-binding protein
MLTRRPLLVSGVLAVVVLTSGCASSRVAPASTVASTTGPKVAEITVAAASDLRPAFEELGKTFTNATGTKVTFSFGSSGQLRTQLVNGAPFDLFASASVDYVDEVIAKGRGKAATKADYAFGRLVLWARPGVALPNTVGDLTDPQYARIAIANPEHAPYGLAAKQAMESASVYRDVEQRLVYGENVSDTLRLATSGNADVAIVALSLAIANGSPYKLIPTDLHKPLEQALVVTSSGDPGAVAAAFASFLSGAEGRKVMVRYGFVLPGEATI